MPVDQKLQELFIKNGWTLGLAESCTGGAVAAMLVEIPDCSRYFLGSVVSYSNTSKQQILGVTAKEVVSEECARQMASGALKQFGSTHALSVTGVAGPGGTKVGMVCFALATEKEVVSKTANFGGTRGEVIAQAKEEMLYYLWNYVSTNR